MTPQPAVEQRLQRIIAISWRVDMARTRSGAALLREYLRRAALWAERLNAAGEWPFFDVAAHVAADVRAHPEHIRRLHAALAVGYLHPVVKQSCEWSLHWTALRDAGVEPASPPDPFEPLLDLYERAGPFTTEHGSFVVGAATISRRTWREWARPEPVTALGPAALEALDSGSV
jgi:hypothetical protein